MNSKLQPLRIIKYAILLIWRRRHLALFISLPIILLHIISGIGADTGAFRIFVYDGDIRLNATYLSPDAQIFLHICGVVFLSFLLIVMAVYWHRSILLDETAPKGIPLRFDATVWRCMWYGFLICVFFVIVVLLFVAAVGLAPYVGFGVFNVVFYAAVLLVVWFGVALFRLALVLPAKAVARPNFGFRAAWRLSKGNGWQLLATVFMYIGASLVLALPFIAFSVLVSWPIGGGVAESFKASPRSLIEFVYAVSMAVQTLFGAGVLSITYAFLTHNEAKPEDGRTN